MSKFYKSANLAGRKLLEKGRINEWKKPIKSGIELMKPREMKK